MDACTATSTQRKHTERTFECLQALLARAQAEIPEVDIVIAAFTDEGTHCSQNDQWWGSLFYRATGELSSSYSAIPAARRRTNVREQRRGRHPIDDEPDDDGPLVHRTPAELAATVRRLRRTAVATLSYADDLLAWGRWTYGPNVIEQEICSLYARTPAGLR